ncbi:predicted protein [Histoplasma capsulatum var. duboisii H88]|uniref:Predicted protein n=2 Tax=Ajellomyces capsulatus TaxID=5037 RepID=F0UUP7_AJEC8|nr:predicted protein [Histoplasma capsulatum H143]EGC49624.1 predicted protein [Histoplasma capsulatum var. duboisii H88]
MTAPRRVSIRQVETASIVVCIFAETPDDRQTCFLKRRRGAECQAHGEQSTIHCRRRYHCWDHGRTHSGCRRTRYYEVSLLTDPLTLILGASTTWLPESYKTASLSHNRGSK